MTGSTPLPVSTHLKSEIEAANLADMATEDQRESAYFYRWAAVWRDANQPALARLNQHHAALTSARARAALFALIGNGS